jgi:hypothetical protein
MKVSRVHKTGHCGSAAWTLPELMVAIAIGMLVLAAIFSFSLYGLRSFAAMSNYADLDEKSRLTLDHMTKEIRQTSAVTDFQANGAKRWLELTNTTPGATNPYVKYTWEDNTLYFETTTEPFTAVLTECDDWQFSLYQRTPIPNTTNQFYPATNISGKIDFRIAKLVDMKWRCSRTMYGKAFQTETVQSTKVVLRNR